ncbi:MAG: hypothetical protein JXR68_05545 [Bacteroidales bacterium]|nr:hypothetical protein [Bacteroidales bacterium]
MIPEIEHPIWEKIITGEIKHDFSNYVLQLQVYKTQDDFKINKISLNQAIVNIHEVCTKYSRAVQKDIDKMLNYK